MKLFIASDIHGSAFYCHQMMKCIERENPHKIILLGDLLYHGPRNDLPKEYNPKAVISMLNKLSDRILCVRGNCEAEVDQMVLDFPVLSDTLVIYQDDLSILATHGHVFNLSNPPKISQNEILLHGHTHVPSLQQTENGYFYINPGSISIPKDNSCNSYMVLENRTFCLKDLNGQLVSSMCI